MPKIVRITTVPLSLQVLLRGQLAFMKSRGFDVTMISSDGAEVPSLVKQEGCPHMVVTMTRTISPWRDFQALVKLVRILRRIRPDIVHTHTPKAGIIGMLAALIARVPHRLHTVAGMPLLEAKGTVRRILDVVEKLTYRCATHVYPNSKGLEAIILSLGFCKPSKLKVLANGSSNGIDTGHFDPALYSAQDRAALRASLGIDPADRVFVFVGRLVKDKGINELVTAFLRLQEQRKNLKLLLVGDYEQELDPLLPETMEHIRSHPQIIGTGFQKDVRPYLAISDALVFPTYREGFPNVVMQAGSMGLPGIVTDINGCNEIIVQGRNGMIIPVKQVEPLYDAMRMMLDDNEAWERMKARARDMIVTRYEQRVVWEAILTEYRNIGIDV